MARTAIITGANSGLGLECARALLRRDGDWHVALAVRDPARGADAAPELNAPERCKVLALDLASLRSVRQFVQSYPQADLPPTHALICNAGIQLVSRTEFTEDGIELTFGVNHLGHFALVTEMLAQLARPARIVVVSSDTHDPSRRTGMPAPRYESAAVLAQPPVDAAHADGRRRYTTSKLCNVLFTYELARRLQGDEVTVNVFNPGLMPGSGLARDYSGIQRFAWRFVMPVLRVLPQVSSTSSVGQPAGHAGRGRALRRDERHVLRWAEAGSLIGGLVRRGEGARSVGDERGTDREGPSVSYVSQASSYRCVA